jgi:DNA-directed RNA polymerase specialized sigma24 family protein
MNPTAKIFPLSVAVPLVEGVSERALLPLPQQSSSTLRPVSAVDERRKQILADPKLHESIRKVIRLRGTPNEDVDDVLNDVIADACQDAKLPVRDPEETRLYLCGCARYKSIDRARTRKRNALREVTPADDVAVPHPKALDEHVFAHQLAALGRKLFPHTFSWFERTSLRGELHAEVAAEAKKSPAYVRMETSNIRRTLRDSAVAVGTLLLVLLAIVWGPRHGRLGDIDDRPVAAPRQTAPEPTSAAGLRDLGKRECAGGEWARCLKHLAKAASVDPGGDTPELQELREIADRNVQKQGGGTGN